jgi:hypothetical protein
LPKPSIIGYSFHTARSVPAGITEPERQELAKLDTFFADEDRELAATMLDACGMF